MNRSPVITTVTESGMPGSSVRPPADYSGNGTDDIGIFRGPSGLWSVWGGYQGVLWGEWRYSGDEIGRSEEKQRRVGTGPRHAA